VIGGAMASPSAAPLVIEDARPGSGHMQVQHPAPCDGFFDPAVTLGQRVRKGDILGTVCGLLGVDVMPVAAERAGVVLMLRTFPRVSAGEGMAVVVETAGTPHTWTDADAAGQPSRGPEAVAIT
jgi:predicted deacylase